MTDDNAWKAQYPLPWKLVPYSDGSVQVVAQDGTPVTLPLPAKLAECINMVPAMLKVSERLKPEVVKKLKERVGSADDDRQTP